MEEGRRRRHTNENYELDQRRYDDEKLHHRSRDRDEIPGKTSSIIAQYSYQNAQKPSEREKAKKSLRYRKNRNRIDDDNDTEQYNNKKEPVGENNTAHPKTVDWKRQQRDSKYNNLQHTSREINSLESENENSEEREGRFHRSLSDQGRTEKQPKYSKMISVNSSRTPDYRLGRRKTRFSDSVDRVILTSDRPQRERSNSPVSRIKYMPFRYKKSPEIERYTVLRKREVSLERPTIMQLNAKNRIPNFSPSYQHSFLKDLDLPCKCCKCNRKYAELVALNSDMQTLRVIKSPINCRPCKCLNKPKVSQKIVLNYSSENISENNDCIDLEGSVVATNSMKFESFQLCLDPKITEYFYSILEEVNYY